MHFAHQLANNLVVHTLVGHTGTSHLIVRGQQSILIDCHSANLRRWLVARDFPIPDMILHTHVQPEHCRQGSQFCSSHVFVHEALAELASDRVGYERQTQTVWDNPADWPVTRGQEKYGVAGAVTSFPPILPLKLSGTFRDGERLAWRDLVLEVVSLPGHGLHHCGFILELAGRPLAVFIGDLFCHPAKLVNMYDLESHYGGTSLPLLPNVLRRLADGAVDLFFPATGPPIADGSDAARQLAGAIDDYLESLAWQSPGASVQGVQYERVGRYIRLHHGVYQIANGGGNCILLIDDCGRGLMFDPGPCDFDKPDRSKLFQDDLVLFEREHGLKTVDMAIITHIHGDHYDMIPQLQLRYPSCRIATSGRVACVVEAPWDYSYPALLPWYNEGFDHVPVDIVLDEDRSYCWHDIGIRTIHLPGHCDRHAGYLLTFNGLRLAITGDTIQTNGEPAGLEFIVANDSVPDSESGILKSYRQLAVEKVDLNLGGHGSYFINCREQYVRSLQRIEHSLPALRQLFRNGDLRTAFRRPSRA